MCFLSCFWKVTFALLAKFKKICDQRLFQTSIVIRRSAHHLNVGAVENISSVRESLVDYSHLSIPSVLSNCTQSYDTEYSVLHLNLRLWPYEIQFKQQLKPIDWSFTPLIGCYSNSFFPAMSFISQHVVMPISKISAIANYKWTSDFAFLCWPWGVSRNSTLVFSDVNWAPK